MSDSLSQSGVSLVVDTEDATSHVTEQEVRQYLRDNPEFFSRNADLLEQIEIPHQHKGSVSLVEKQSEQLRRKVRMLSNKLNQLFDVARQNEKLFRVYSNLNGNLFHCDNLQQISDLLEETLIDQLDMSSVVIKPLIGAHALPELQRRLIWEKRFKENEFFFGRISQHEKQLLFGNLAAESVALMLIGDTQPIAIIAIGSNEAGHFTPDMDTLLIKQLQQVLNLVMPKLLVG